MQTNIMQSGIRKIAFDAKSATEKLLRKTEMSDVDQKWLAQTTERHISELASLCRKTCSKNKHAEYAQTERVLASFKGRLSAVVRILQDTKAPSAPQQLSRADLEALANSFALDVPLPGTAKLVLVPQGNKAPRVALDFGWQIRAAHLLVADVLEAKGTGNTYEFNAQGRGRDRASALVRDAILSGYTTWITFDLKNHYSSVGPKHLKWLNLPPKVIRHSVFCNAEMPIDCSPERNRFLKAARHGLPTGAMLSGKIASGFVGRILRSISGDCRVWSYVDDVAIGVRSPAEANDIADAIKSGFENNPAGPLAFKKFCIDSAESGFSFLNYRFRQEWRDGEEHVHIHPDKSAFKNLQYKLSDKFDGLSPSSFDERAELARQFTKRWASAHGLWEPNAYAISNLECFAEVCAADYGTVCAKLHMPLLSEL